MAWLCALYLEAQVIPSDPRAVLMTQRLEGRGGDCGSDPGVQAELELDSGLLSWGAGLPPLGSPGANVEVASPGDSRGLALLLEKPLALRCSLVASGGVWACCMCIFSIPKPVGGVSSRNTAPNTLLRENTSLKTKTKKPLVYLDVCYYLVGLARGHPPWEVSKPGPCSDPGKGSMPGLWKGAPSKTLELRQPLGREPGAVES